MGFGLQEYLLAILAIVFGIYYYNKSFKLNYWKKNKVPGPRPVPFFGNFIRVFFKRTTIGETIDELYKEWKHEPFIGVYKGQKPQLIIHNLDLIKTILIKDFNIFSGRGMKINEDIDPLAAHLVNLDGPRWKLVRSKLTPIFTTGKLKQMIELMVECANHFEKYLKIQVGKGCIIDCREVAAKFTTDVIGSCAFGIDMNALSKEESEFRKMGRKVFQPSFFIIIKRLLSQTTPWLFEFLKLRIISKDVTEFFIGSINETIAIRKNDKIVRNDLIDLLIDIQKTTDNNSDIKITDRLMTAQAFVFFTAGFETSSTTISFALYELALNPKIQDKLRNEILHVLKEYNGQLNYDIMNNMKYLEMIIQETLRKDSPVLTLIRQANQPYKIPGTSITIEKGIHVNIPIYSIHYDSNYFPEPHIFDPERFSEEAKSKMHPMTHLPFGDGPKGCIAMRFAIYQVKLGLIKVLTNFKVEPSKLTLDPYEIDPRTFILAPKGGVKLILKPLK